MTRRELAARGRLRVITGVACKLRQREEVDATETVSAETIAGHHRVAERVFISLLSHDSSVGTLTSH